MKVHTIKRCPHCDKPIDIRVLDVDPDSIDELQALLKAILRS